MKGPPKKELARLEAGARKSLSQNFLTSPHWQKLLVDSVLDGFSGDAVWEIGPGLGALSAGLIGHAKAPVTLFEYDRKLSADLRARFPETNLVEGDFLEVDLSSIPGKEIAVLSNTPYHLSSPLLFAFLDIRARVSRLVLTFQKEFADRLVAKPRTKDYSALSVLAQSTFRIENLGVLPKGAFYPAPKVDSRALRLFPLPPKPNWETFRDLVKLAFAHRRKKLISNLKSSYPTEKLESAFTQMGLKETARPEELSPSEFERLTSLIISAN